MMRPRFSAVRMRVELGLLELDGWNATEGAVHKAVAVPVDPAAVANSLCVRLG